MLMLQTRRQQERLLGQRDDKPSKWCDIDGETFGRLYHDGGAETVTQAEYDAAAEAENKQISELKIAEAFLGSYGGVADSDYPYGALEMYTVNGILPAGWDCFLPISVRLLKGRGTKWAAGVDVVLCPEPDMEGRIQVRRLVDGAPAEEWNERCTLSSYYEGARTFWAEILCPRSRSLRGGSSNVELFQILGGYDFKETTTLRMTTEPWRACNINMQLVSVACIMPRISQKTGPTLRMEFKNGALYLGGFEGRWLVFRHANNKYPDLGRGAVKLMLNSVHPQAINLWSHIGGIVSMSGEPMMVLFNLLSAPSGRLTPGYFVDREIIVHELCTSFRTLAISNHSFCPSVVTESHEFTPRVVYPDMPVAAGADETDDCCKNKCDGKGKACKGCCKENCYNLKCPYRAN